MLYTDATLWKWKAIQKSLDLWRWSSNVISAHIYIDQSDFKLFLVATMRRIIDIQILQNQISHHTLSSVAPTSVLNQVPHAKKRFQHILHKTIAIAA